MSEMSLPCEGGCRCGQVRFRVSAPPILTMACHCKGCQRMTGSAYSLSAAIPTPGFEVIRGETVRGGTKQGPIQHNVCPNCMSWMFTRMEGMDFFVNVRATLLDDAKWFVPFVETETREKLPWVTTPAKHSYEAMPEPDVFQMLTQEFAKQTG